MQTVVGVLRGGPSREHELSLQSGAAILAKLPEERFEARDIYIDRTGQWHDRGRRAAPERILRQLDVVLVGLRGEYGEDGEVQKILERFGVPFAGADSFGSSLAMHKLISKVRAKEAGLLTPRFHYIERAEESEEGTTRAVRDFHQPVVVKPVDWGSSIGVSVVSGYAPALEAVQKLFADGAPAVLVEEYIRGREVTVGVVENLRGEELYALPPVEIVPPAGDFYSFEAKRSKATLRLCPAKLSRFVSEELLHVAKAAHRALGLRHYSRSDFIATPKGIYYLETNTLPGLAEESDFSLALASVGVPLPDFFGHLVNLARSR